MSALIDLCGTPIQLESVRGFRLVKREYLFYPKYQETKNQMFSVFARMGASDKKKFAFVEMVPFGALLNEKEKPCTGSYEIKSFGEAVAANILSDVGKKIGNAANLAADMLRVDTSGNIEYHVLTTGRRLISIKRRDVPAKVVFLSGKSSDIYKNDSIYEFLGEPIAPTIEIVPTLVVAVDKTSYVFFGAGIDLEDAEATYHALLETYNQFHEERRNEKTASLPRLSLNVPRLSIPKIRIQPPFVIQRKENEVKLLEQDSQSDEDIVKRIE